MNEIRFAFVGFGNIAKTHMVALKSMPIIKNLPFVPVLDTLVTRNPEVNQEQAYAIGFKKVVATVEEALTAGDFQVVDICTPNANHPDAFFPALHAGKSIYCEKPLADRYDRSRAMSEAAEDGSGRRHQVALVYRYHPAVLRIKEIIRQGLIGNVLQCRCSYRRSGYLDAARPVSWRLDERQSGGGAISDLGIHVLDLLKHLFGEILEVDGTLRTHVRQRPASDSSGKLVDVHVDDWAGIEIIHRNGVRCTAEVSRIAWGLEAFQIDVIGTNGSVTCDLEKEYVPRIKLLDGSAPAVPSPAELSLSTDEKTTMGMAVDTHFAALHHYLLRVTGTDPYGTGLAPTLKDALEAEYWIDQLLQRTGGIRNDS
ncbi:Gfo/Idh/MocA family protein [Gorillibacterium sp. sgz5001074]|uniref:Gfo/Idh/MocA family protein n=1 Tax=Gorillibacterium sp. sgz5001074 TaxID=3446695 RepID=UPI003F668C63